MTPWTHRAVASLRRDPHALATTATSDRPGDAWTAAEMLERAAGGVALLDALGCERGHPIPALFSSRPGALAVLLAGATSGRPLAPVPPRLTVHELSQMIHDLPGQVLLTDTESVETARVLAAATGRRAIVVDEPPRATTGLRVPDDPDQVVLVLHTSGTTGHPKRVPVRDIGLGHRTSVSGRVLQLARGDVYVGASPFHHIGGVGNLAVALAHGTTVASFPRFTVESWRALEAVGATHAQTVPTMIEMLLRADALHVRSLRVLVYGGSPMHPGTLRAAMAQLPDVDFVNFFGQTEGSPLSCLTPADHRRALAGDTHLLASVGRPLPEVEIRLDDGQGGQDSELWARGDHLSLTDAEGWLRTGDAARLDEDGYIYLAGRQGDMIIRGGENVHPVEVEQVLLDHPDIEDIAVVGTPDAVVGQAVKAFIVPTFWQEIDAIPRNPSGKVLRRLLAEDHTGVRNGAVRRDRTADQPHR
jgi:acyl-CoA synthetase (AMP-forming)/AMP-acid ligase II